MKFHVRSVVCLVSLAVAVPEVALASPASDWTGAPPAVEAAPAAAPVAQDRPVRKAKRSCPRGKRCVRRRPRPDPALVEAEAIRGQILRSSESMIAAGRHAEAATLLADAARSRVDPVLYLAAAEVQLARPRADGRALDEASALSTEAKALVLRPAAPRITPDAAPELLEHSELLATYAARRHDQLRQQRRGRAQLVTGGSFLALGVGGFVLLTAGAALGARVDTAGADYEGVDEGYRAALARTGERADTMVAAGLIAGLVGMAIGAPLTAAGARELKRSRGAGGERPRLRIAPGLAGLSVSGRF